MVVSNTSPIINLAAIGHLDLLPLIFTTITIPYAVYEEITVIGHGKPGAAEIVAASWIEMQQVANASLTATLMNDVNRGEAEAIALSIERSAQLLLIDERKGRLLATNYGVSVTGILGILMLAREQKLINTVRPLLDDLRKFGFWIDQQLYAYILHHVGER